MELVTKICGKCGKKIKLGYLPRESYAYKKNSGINLNEILKGEQ